MKTWIRSSVFSVSFMCIFVSTTWAIEPIFEIFEQAEAVDVENGHLYAAGRQTLSIFSLANPAQPRMVSQIPMVKSLDISVERDRAYVVMVGEGTAANPDPLNFWIIDVSDPANPAVLHRLHVAERAQGVYATDGLVYIAASYEGVLIVDPNAAGGPTLVGTIDVAGETFDVHVRGDRAYVGAEYKLVLFDISDKANPLVLDRADFDGFGLDLAAEGELLAVAQEWDGVGVYDISDPNKLSILYHYTYPSAQIEQQIVLGLDLWNLYVYVCLAYQPSYDVTAPPELGGLSILDVLRPRSVREVDRRRIEGDMPDVVAYEGYIYGAEGDLGISVYRHGAGVRVTATPTRPTPTPTKTYTPTPTATPPGLIKPTSTPGQAPTHTPTRLPPTPTPTHTPTRVPPTPTHIPTPVKPTPTLISPPTPTWTSTPTQTPTRVPPTPTPTSPPVTVPTPTPVPGLGPVLLFASRFDTSFIQQEGWNPMLPFSGTFQLALHTIGAIPTDGAFEGTTDGRGLHILLAPGQALTLVATAPVNTFDLPVLLRLSVRADTAGARVALAALDGAGAGSVASFIPVNSVSFLNRYRRLELLYNPDSDAIIPIVQVVHVSGDTMNVYLDNFEAYAIPKGAMVSAEFLGADGTTP